jgi:hypothetical protein
MPFLNYPSIIRRAVPIQVPPHSIMLSPKIALSTFQVMVDVFKVSLGIIFSNLVFTI